MNLARGHLRGEAPLSAGLSLGQLRRTRIAPDLDARARAIENQCYVLGVNRVGDAEGLMHAGDSALIEPLGETVAEVGDQPAPVCGDVDTKRVGATRGLFSFLADRRPDVYREL